MQQVQPAQQMQQVQQVAPNRPAWSPPQQLEQRWRKQEPPQPGSRHLVRLWARPGAAGLQRIQVSPQPRPGSLRQARWRALCRVIAPGLLPLEPLRRAVAHSLAPG